MALDSEQPSCPSHDQHASWTSESRHHLDSSRSQQVPTIRQTILRCGPTIPKAGQAGRNDIHCLQRRSICFTSRPDFARRSLRSDDAPLSDNRLRRRLPPDRLEIMETPKDRPIQLGSREPGSLRSSRCTAVRLHLLETTTSAKTFTKKQKPKLQLQPSTPPLTGVNVMPSHVVAAA